VVELSIKNISTCKKGKLYYFSQTTHFALWNPETWSPYKPDVHTLSLTLRSVDNGDFKH